MRPAAFVLLAIGAFVGGDHGDSWEHVAVYGIAMAALTIAFVAIWIYEDHDRREPVEVDLDFQDRNEEPTPAWTTPTGGRGRGHE